jgi:hypothetical protein
MRRFLFLLPPVMAMWLACMQTAPGENSCDDVRIGGNSVGCGNPTKAYALKEMVDINCRSGGCTGHPADSLLTRHISTEIVNGKLRITVESLSDSAQKGIMLDDEVHAFVRLFNHNPVLDTTPLGGKSFFGNKTLELDYNYFCGQLDIPDKACSLRKVDTVDLMVQITWNPMPVSSPEIFRGSAFLGPVRLVVGDSNLTFDPSLPLADTVLLSNSTEALGINVVLPPKTSDSVLWVAFLPGTHIRSSMSCWENGRFDLKPIPKQKFRIFLAEIRIGPSNFSVSVHSLKLSSHQDVVSSRLQMEMGDVIYTLPIVDRQSIFTGIGCP